MEASLDEVKFSALMPEKLDIKTAKADSFRSWHQQWKEFYQLTGLEEQVQQIVGIWITNI